MRKFTIEQYEQLAELFNKMTFRDKMKSLQHNSDILTLGSDHNYWIVKVIDKDIERALRDNETYFKIQHEWDSYEMGILIELLGIGNVDA